MKTTIVVCEYGWILCGLIQDETDEDLTLKSASVVRSWRNGKGIGGLAKYENRGDYMLDPIGDVTVMKGKILFCIDCEW